MLVHSGPAADPETRDVVDLQPAIDHVADYIRRHMPLLDASAPALRETCMCVRARLQPWVGARSAAPL